MPFRKQELIKRFYPDKNTNPFRLFLDDAIQTADVVLDAGCGNGSSFQYDYKTRLRNMIGVDILWGEVVQNRQVHFSSVADLESLPFANQTLDLIFSHDVIEDLKRPDEAIAEFSQVLKSGGKLIVLTPNNFHYFAIAGHVVPHSMQKIIANKLMKSPGEVFKTYYRCNSIKRMTQIAAQFGLVPINICLYEPPPKYMAFSVFTFYPAVAYERLVNRYKWLSIFRAQLIGIFQKI